MATIDTHGLAGTYHFAWGLGETFDPNTGYWVGSIQYQTPETPVRASRLGNAPLPTDGPVQVTQTITPPLGNAVNYAVSVTTRAGNAVPSWYDNGFGQYYGPDTIWFTGPPPTATTGSLTPNGEGTMTATGQIAPNGFALQYHFLVTDGSCGGGVSYDTPEQSLASGGQYTPVNVTAPVSVVPGAPVSVQLVVDYGPASPAASGAVVKAQAPGPTNSGDVTTVDEITPSRVTVNVALGTTSPLLAEPPGINSYHDVRVNYGRDSNYGSATGTALWPNPGGCPFYNSFTITDLTPATEYHAQVQAGAPEPNPEWGLQSAGYVSPYVWTPFASGPDFTFWTAAGNPLGGPVWSPKNDTVGQEVACTAATSCAGSMSYVIGTLKKAANASVASVRKVILATVRFRIRAHSRRLITVRLSGPTQRLLTRLHIVRLTEVLTMRAGGGPAVTTQRTVTLRSGKPASRHRRHR